MDFGCPVTNFAAIPRPAFGRSAQHAEPATAAKTRADIRHMREAKSAAEVLTELPAIGEAVHLILSGTFDLCSVVTATVQRFPPAQLRIATLAASRRNTVELLGVLESFPRMKFSMVASEFWKAHNRELFEQFSADLREHPAGARLAAARSHAKLVCFDYGPGDGLSFTGSANLRKNGCIEQLCITRHRSLHDFYASFIDRTVQTNAQENAPAKEVQPPETSPRRGTLKGSIRPGRGERAAVEGKKVHKDRRSAAC